MSILVSRVLSHADKLPIVGPPLSNATASWLPPHSYRSNKRHSLDSRMDSRHLDPSIGSSIHSVRLDTGPPPSYDQVVQTQTCRTDSQPQTKSAFTKLSGYVWKRASFCYGDTPIQKHSTQETIDRKQVEHAMTLLNVATEMGASGNHSMALDLYLMGLDKLISSLPLQSNPAIKAALEEKLIEFKERKQLDLPVIEETPFRSQISSLIVNAAILGAVALKKSPIPDVFSYLLNTVISSAQNVDANYHIRQRTWDLAGRSVSKAIEIDRQYEIHQMVTEAICTSLTAVIKAGLAYLESPGYREPQSRP